jgi:hemerythrin superfamily protein
MATRGEKDACDLLDADHRAVKRMFKDYEELTNSRGRSIAQKKMDLARQICHELTVHAQIEEEIFYPAVQKVSGRIQHAREEHARVAGLIGDVEGRDPASPEFMDGVRQLKTAVMHHVAEEEGPIFEEAARLGDAELVQLGARLAERKQAVKTSPVQRGVRAVKQAARKIA